MSLSTSLLRSTSFDTYNKNNFATTFMSPDEATLKRSSSSSSYNKYSYKTCPMCSERLLVRIHGAFVHKWINLHFATRHHEWMHVVVNLH
ncbi:hypothetical protein K501DRAFT_63754 [Backusella circina FSU 941]|nr:hypothetical protein K501DRAFT_63754 [Backusella circina FSU 941]